MSQEGTLIAGMIKNHIPFFGDILVVSNKSKHSVYNPTIKHFYNYQAEMGLHKKIDVWVHYS